MPRVKKQRLKRRSDGYYVCRYKDQWFYSLDEEDCLAQREEYKRLEQQQITAIPTVSDFAEKWISRAFPSAAKSTMTGLRIHLRKLTDAIGNVQLPDVKPSMIKQIYSESYIGLSNSYIKAARQLFCSLFDAAVADGYLRSNPAREKASAPHKGSTGGHRAITEQERTWILTLCKDHRAHAAVVTMLYAGIRPQEAKALDIDKAVNKKAGTLSVMQTAHYSGPNSYEITSKGKTDKANRTIPLLPPVEEALEGKHGLLITTENGKQVTPTVWKRIFRSYKHQMEEQINGISFRWYGRTKEQRQLAEEGKLPPWIEFTVVPYDLRHSFCTMCRDAGVELHTCVEWMGHKDATMIMRIYDEVSENRSDSEAEKLKKSLFRSGNGSGENTIIPAAVEE